MSRLRIISISKDELERRVKDGSAYLDLVVKGKWIPTENEEMEIDGYFCSVCDLPMETEEKTDFCPNCGADMRKDEPDAPITREEIESGITVYVDGKYDPIFLGHSPHDGNMYKCSKCGKVYSDWEWFGKKEFTCTCGATWDVPK